MTVGSACQLVLMVDCVAFMFRSFCVLRWIYRQKYDNLRWTKRRCIHGVVWSLSFYNSTSTWNMFVTHLSSKASDKSNRKTCPYYSASLYDWHVIHNMSALPDSLRPNFLHMLWFLTPFGNLHQSFQMHCATSCALCIMTTLWLCPVF